MTTTLVRDSIVGDAWITQTANNVPIQKVIDSKGNETGDILTGPVRLAFDTLFELPQPTATVPNPKYGSALLFTPLANLELLRQVYNSLCQKDFPDQYDANTQSYPKVHSPFRNQDEKVKFNGFTPGCFFISCSSKYKPPVVDLHKNPILDSSKVYPGVWAICAINAYSYNSPHKKGIGFGLQSVMIIADDTKFGGTAPDPNETFAATRGAIQAPAISATQVGGMPNPPVGGTHAAPPPPSAAHAMPGQLVQTSHRQLIEEEAAPHQNDMAALL